AEFLSDDRQTLMFSATLPMNIVKLSQRFLKNPERITIGSSTTPVSKIKQEVIHSSAAEKLNHLLTELDRREGSIIVFVKTKRSAEKLSSHLQRHGHSTNAMHGDLEQRKRERVLQAFRDLKSRIMVATDIAARGLDIPHIKHV